MIRFLYISIFLSIALIINSCSHQFSLVEIENYWNQTRFIVPPGVDISGRYRCSSGFDATHIELRNDSSCFYSRWIDIQSEEDEYINGYNGHYSICVDTLYFHVESYEYHKSLSDSALRYANEKYPNDSTFHKYTFKWLFKKVNNDLILADQYAKLMFADFMLKQEYYFYSKTGERLGVFFPMRVTTIE